MKNKTAEIIDTSMEKNSPTSSSVNASLSEIGIAVLETGKTMGRNAGKMMATTAELVGDFNGDGKVDIEDAKIALAKAKQLASSMANESAKLGKEVMKSELVKDVAPYAAIGAAIAVPIPIIGPAIGAALGAGLGLYKNATKKK